jgi:hypothetical protein
MQNIYLEQTSFFTAPSRQDLRHLDADERTVAYELASISETMPNWNDPKLDLHSPYYFLQGTHAKGKNDAGNSVAIYLSTESIPFGLTISAEGFARIVKEFHLVSLAYYMSYSTKTKLIKIHNTEMKVGKFIKLLNPAISDKFLNTVVNEWHEEINKPTINVLQVKASDMYKKGIGPISCMTGASVVNFWDAVGSTGMVLLYNNRIVARCLVHAGGFYDKVYSYTESQEEALIAELHKLGLQSVRKSNHTIDIPASFSTIDLPYMDSFKQSGHTLVVHVR